MNYQEALAQVDRFRARAQSLREAAAAQMESAVDTVAIMGGGALSGYIAAAYGDKELLGVRYNVLLGVGLSAVGLFELAGRESHVVGALGEGMLAHAVGDIVAKKVLEKKSSTKTAGVGALDQASARLLGMGSVSDMADAIRIHQQLAAA